jgi:hypothetical protein
MNSSHLRSVFLVIASLALVACVPTYTLVAPGPVAVAKKGLSVQPQAAWNRIPKNPSNTQWEESWTRNGPLLDSIAFVDGLPDGKTLLVQQKKADQQVPAFRADMNPNDLVSMVESYYRIGAGATVFEVTSVQPTPFLGAQGVRLDFTYVAGDDVPRKGRCVMKIAGQKLYVMKLEGVASHYFDAVAPEFESMTASAVLR